MLIIEIRAARVGGTREFIVAIAVFSSGCMIFYQPAIVLLSALNVFMVTVRCLNSTSFHWEFKSFSLNKELPYLLFITSKVHQDNKVTKRRIIVFKKRVATVVYVAAPDVMVSPDEFPCFFRKQGTNYMFTYRDIIPLFR